MLLLVCALLALDSVIERVGRMRGWTNPVAWLGGALTIFGSLLFMVALMPSFGGQSHALANRYEALAERLTASGFAPATDGPIITDFPIWLAEATGAHALALPDETPSDVLDLAAAFPGTSLLIVNGDSHGSWPAILDSGAEGANCFEEIDIGASSNPALAHALDDTRVFRLVCP